MRFFFRLTAPRCPSMTAGAVSMKKSHDIVILSFCNIVKGQANYAAWYVPYHSDPFKNPFEDYMIDLIYPELDLPWCISLWSGVLLFILHQITFIFWYKDWGQESAFCTGQLRLQISRREHVFWIDIYGGGW